MTDILNYKIHTNNGSANYFAYFVCSKNISSLNSIKKYN